MSDMQVVVAGAAPDTGNLGVSALCYSAVSKLNSLLPNLGINILDHGSGIRRGAYSLNDGTQLNLMGAKGSRRFFEGSNFANIRFCTKYLPVTQEARLMRRASAIMDISGGDSFTDLYGKKRFTTITYPKLIALENNIPLVLLPQTYGPFESEEHRRLAEHIVRGASMAFARDCYSFEVLKQMLGDSFDPVRHQQAVDVAFILPKSSDEILQQKNMLPVVESGREIFGFNISGLVLNDPEGAKRQFNISLDYHQVVLKTLEHILENSDGLVYLVPHVLAPLGHFESDNQACETIKSALKPEYKERVFTVTGDYDQCDIKGVIAHCDWFCGTRMHSTIASLSSQVPTAAIA
ncbi:Uncharacterized conserved protein, partial [Alteromonadaceae bacterium Bs31]